MKYLITYRPTPYSLNESVIIYMGALSCCNKVMQIKLLFLFLLIFCSGMTNEVLGHIM